MLTSDCASAQVDRTTMGLYYSGNAVDWWPAGVLDYHLVRPV